MGRTEENTHKWGANRRRGLCVRESTYRQKILLACTMLSVKRE